MQNVDNMDYLSSLQTDQFETGYLPSTKNLPREGNPIAPILFLPADHKQLINRYPWDKNYKQTP